MSPLSRVIRQEGPGALALLIAMGVLGGISRRASPSARRTSLFVRVALGLAAVYLMVAKPF